MEESAAKRLWAAVYGAMFAHQLDRLQLAQIEVTGDMAAHVDAIAATAADLALEARSKAVGGGTA